MTTTLPLLPERLPESLSPGLSTGRHTGLTVADAMEPCEYQIADDSTVDQANDILCGAHVDYLLVRDHNGRCAGLVSRASLHPFLARSWYTERTPIRDTAHQRGPFAWPGLGLRMASLTMIIKDLAIWPVVDDDGYLLGVIKRDRVQGMLRAGALV
ncbi:CBS domain-containing protein [Streptacidiphilus sp. MAP12-20]|uniref:CBS domain-containing protein n=1 Tax=Streptacidiphilus sp. MAP12-20 TaxID=3156299 RepID=UPI003514F348